MSMIGRRIDANAMLHAELMLHKYVLHMYGYIYILINTYGTISDPGWPWIMFHKVLQYLAVISRKYATKGVHPP